MRPCSAGDFLSGKPHDVAIAAITGAVGQAGRAPLRRLEAVGVETVAPTPRDVDCLPDVGSRARLTPPRLIER